MYSKCIAAILTLLVCLGIDVDHIATAEHAETSTKTNVLTQSESVSDQKLVPTAAVQTEDEDLLSAEEAEALVLAHAELDARDVWALHAEPDFEFGALVWDVEFRAGDWDYDYTVHAGSGEILKQERDYEPQKRTETEAKPAEPSAVKPTEPVIPAPQTPTVEKLTAEAAEEIALAHAGLSRTAVRGLRTELDRDDGRTVYEIEFRDGAVEYEYEIDAQSGNVLDWDRDYDD